MLMESPRQQLIPWAPEPSTSAKVWSDRVCVDDASVPRCVIHRYIYQRKFS